MRLFLSAPGLVTALGTDTGATWDALLNARSGLREIKNFYGQKSFYLGALEKDLSTNEILALALEQIAPQIRSTISKFGANRVAVVIGTTVTGVESNYRVFLARARTGEFAGYDESKNTHCDPANFARSKFGLSSLAIGVSSACTSGQKAIIEAARLIRSGVCDAAICGGCDAIDTLTTLGFDALGVLSSERANPFSKNRKGTNLGAGAGVFVLSREEISDVELLGWACNCDAYHVTKPNPTATMQIAAIKMALERSNLKNADYASLHATGTLANDEMEAAAISATLPHTLAGGLKGALGHTLGAAGAIEMGVCYMAISRGVIPPHVAHGEMIEGANLCLEAKPASVNSAINLSFAFGGDNVASVIGRR